MYRIGVDIGGTFTDFVIIQEGTGVARLHKQLTTPNDPSQAVIEGICSLLDDCALAMGDLSEIVHGTTLVTNALIERRGGPTGMLVTHGMRDILDIARERRYDLFDLRLRFPEPVVKRDRRRQINERISHDGVIMQALDLDEVRFATRDLVDREGIEALAICFLNSYANPAHEKQAESLLSREFPDLKISCSASVVPYIREYERWTTTTMNAYVQPVVDRYIQRIESRLNGIGFRGQFHIMTSSGGMVTPSTARRFPIRLLESGPAAGALMAARIGLQKDSPRILSFDMGGTTAKGALVRNGKPLKKYELEVARMHEFKAGSGLPARAPVVDMIEIGAGGGSIASIDERGLIRVGPTSAGASPGPACYGGGGTLPTLTDANLILGYLDANNFLGGRMKLDTSAAHRAIHSAISKPLELDLVRAAWGIHETINEDVARAFRVHASERAFDYRQSAMVGFGGCGPIHAVRIARKLNVPTVILPPGAGVMSAFGLLVSSFSFEAARSQRVSIDIMDTNAYTKGFAPLIGEVTEVLHQAGIDPAKVHLTRSMDMRYEGQGYEVEVAVGESPDGLAEKFVSAYTSLFSSVLLDEPIEIVNWKVEGTGPSPVAGLQWGFTMPKPHKGRAEVASRQVYVPELATMSAVPVYDRYQLLSGARITGPAIIEEQESTLVVGRGDLVRVDNDLNLIVTLNFGSTAA
jgi:N-methylhydantoinase A